ncbi:ParB/RepB/Spo0J family partition protein [Saccharibacillus sp. CPCC 101409]|uniref:ParB/RepB/Spo0J family partition protein n=1 Tax=Saccharibacillus sp. CPCC 101409 TaxID=3058041 RepID=UPI002672B70A|nr:ParB/RepB/Spo0J family partition protein [Saccharibacillus sp. CPCC 101409]MDO3413230.1 ParB/RepB/Spo0J family partition protein [Saccharibacillus sp. CPCC 101409]
MGKGLGKGLDALIPSLSVGENDKVVDIPLNQLRANPYQPRQTFDEEGLRELAESIRQHGVIQPIIVRSVLKGYEIIAGERRSRASELAGESTIPAVVRDFTDQQVMEIALIENVQRENLNAMEIAVAYQSLMDEFKITQEELSGKVGKSRSHIANFLRLLTLPDEIKEYVSRGTLSMGHAKAIVGLRQPELQIQLAEKAIREGWSVRELEEAAQEAGNRAKNKTKTKVKKRDPYIENVEDSLREHFKTTVKIKSGGKEKGKIELSYYNQQDLQRLLDLLQ